MTLKEQFKKEVIAAPVMDEVIDYWVSELEQTADEFAIGFAEWIRVCKLKGRSYDFDNIEELLTIYKEEKEL
jgi:hypothetical protein